MLQRHTVSSVSSAPAGSFPPKTSTSRSKPMIPPSVSASFEVPSPVVDHFKSALAADFGTGPDGPEPSTPMVSGPAPPSPSPPQRESSRMMKRKKALLRGFGCRSLSDVASDGPENGNGNENETNPFFESDTDEDFWSSESDGPEEDEEDTNSASENDADSSESDCEKGKEDEDEDEGEAEVEVVDLDDLSEECSPEISLELMSCWGDCHGGLCQELEDVEVVTQDWERAPEDVEDRVVTAEEDLPEIRFYHECLRVWWEKRIQSSDPIEKIWVIAGEIESS